MAARDLGAGALRRVTEIATTHARWVLAGWVLVAALCTLAVPRLEQVVAHDATPFLPASSPSIQAFGQMDKAFAGGSGSSIAFVVLTGPDFHHDSTAAAYYRGLSDRLHADHAHVADLQDYATRPSLRSALTSADGDATYIPLSLRHPVGSPQADADVAWLRATLTRDRPAGVHTFVTGDVASIADLNTDISNSIARVTIVTVVIIIAILLLLYRSWLLPLVPLATIGVGLLVARGLVALLGQSFLPVSTYTAMFVTALVLGAGTDYTVFLISRFHESMRSGSFPVGAVVDAVCRIGPVVVASGLTVIIGSACMVFAHLALFSTTGPAIAVSILVTLVVGLTFTPALLVVMGRHVGPRPLRRRAGTRWATVGSPLARRPVPPLLAALVLLMSLAAFWPRLSPSYDTRALVPAHLESSQGYAALDKHFPGNELRPDYDLVSADHDLRNPRDLAVLEQAAATLDKLPGIDVVRTVTRPQGTPIPQAELTDQLRRVGEKLGTAKNALSGSGSGVARLASGADRLAGGADAVADGAGRATDAVDVFLAGLAKESQGLGTAVSSTGDAADGAAALRSGAARLSQALDDAHDGTSDAVQGLGQIYALLAGDQLCTADPKCAIARTQLHRIYVGERDQLLPGLARARDGAQRISVGDGRLGDGLDQLRTGLQRAAHGIDRLAAGEQTFRSKLGELAGGASALAAGADRLPPGVADLRSAARRLAAGVGEASRYPTGNADAARAAGVSAFSRAARALADPRMATARDYYISRDGHMARLMVYPSNNASHIADERKAMTLALRNTPLADAPLAVTGPTAVDDDIHALADSDLRLIALMTLGAVFLILIVLLRALVAPAYLLASVVLSYGSAMGLTALVWQDLL